MSEQDSHGSQRGLIDPSLYPAAACALLALVLSLFSGELLVSLLIGASAWLAHRQWQKGRQDLQQARVARDRAEAASASKARFLNNLSKELRTPLNVILGFAQIQKNQLGADAPPSLVKTANETLAAGWRMLHLSDDILDIVRMEQGTLQIQLEDTKVSEVAGHALSLVAADAEEAGVSLIIEDSPLLVRSDYTRLKQILVKLFSNAIKYNHRGGEVHFIASAEGSDRVVLRISDTGVGIQPEDRDRIFEPFSRLDYAEREGIPGTGLGLALSRFLVELMGGRIALTDNPGRGACFTLYLPAAQVAGETLVPPTTTPGDSGEDKSSLTVIYVEDDAPSLELMKAILEQESGVSLLTAVNAETGIKLARQHQPDLVLLDINLMGHGIDGIEAARQIKSDPDLAGIELVALSADALETTIDTALQAGFSRYLTKPLDITAINKVLDELRQKSVIKRD